jgi:phage terminase small subunit
MGAGSKEAAKKASAARTQGALTEKTRARYDIFIAEYNASGNASASAVKAGYSEKTASVYGYQLLRKLYIKERITTKAAETIETADLSSEKIVGEYKRIAFSTVGGVYTDWGQLRSFDEIPESVKASIKSITFRKTKEGEEFIKIELYDKLIALAKIDEIMQRAQGSQPQTLNVVHYTKAEIEADNAAKLDSKGQALGNDLFETSE